MWSKPPLEHTRANKRKHDYTRLHEGPTECDVRCEVKVLEHFKSRLAGTAARCKGMYKVRGHDRT